jgi:hypothetical protein
MVINYAQKMNNCNAARKVSVAEPNIRRWKEQKTEAA